MKQTTKDDIILMLKQIAVAYAIVLGFAAVLSLFFGPGPAYGQELGENPQSIEYAPAGCYIAWRDPLKCWEPDTSSSAWGYYSRSENIQLYGLPVGSLLNFGYSQRRRADRLQEEVNRLSSRVRALKKRVAARGLRARK